MPEADVASMAQALAQIAGAFLQRLMGGARPVQQYRRSADYQEHDVKRNVQDTHRDERRRDDREIQRLDELLVAQLQRYRAQQSDRRRGYAGEERLHLWIVRLLLPGG